MIACIAFVRRSWSCLAAPAFLLGCASEAASPVDESNSAALGSVAQPIVALERSSGLPVCQRQNQNQVYYVRSEQQLYFCDGPRLRQLDLDSDPSWLTDTIPAPASLCSSGGLVIRMGPDVNADGKLD